MKKVEFVRLESKMKGYGIGKGVKYIFDDCREIIKEKLNKGGTIMVLYQLYKEAQEIWSKLI